MTTMRRDAILYILVLVLAVAASIISYAATGPDNSAPVVTAPEATIEAMAIALATPSPAYSLTDSERDLIARVCWGEARGEGAKGMEAVAGVVYNRLLDGRFGATVTEVCAPDQFHGLSCTEEAGEGAYEAVAAVFDRGARSELGGALYFCRTETDPDLIKSRLVEVATVGNHVFYID